ncbi:unnamed protein product [Adineta steineri]|uniref:MACPF-like domain-containing protein n=1 Tax=Adineta steineri TaxID=433720 RepID=A0A814T8E1_9BILA|nr:unnamed protein product [Adineta steineri]CAF1586922.1 unnamed protein product [Adineta steineri]
MQNITSVDIPSENYKSVKFELDDGKLLGLCLSPKQFVAEVRQLIGKRQPLKDIHLFLDKEGYPVGRLDESKTPLENVMLSNNIVKLQTQKLLANSNKDSAKPLLDIPPTQSFETRTIQLLTTDKLEYRAAKIPETTPAHSSHDQICDPYNFDLQKWCDIFQRCNLFQGLEFDCRTDPRHPSYSPHPSHHSVCQFQENITKPTYFINDASFIEAHLASNEIHNTFIRNKLVKIDANFKCPFFSFSTGSEKDDRKTEDTQKKTLYTTCIWNFPRVVVHLFNESLPLVRQPVRATDDFQEAIKEVFLEPTEATDAVTLVDIQEKYKKLQKIFKLYGQVFPITVTLGGHLYQTDIRKVERNVNENEHKNKIFGNFKSLLKAVGGGIDGAVTTIEARRTVTIDHQSDAKFEATGGDTLLIDNISEWKSSIRDSRRWRIIQYGELIPTYNLLNNQLQKKIEDVLYHKKRFGE